jgi:hypothetical protein
MCVAASIYPTGPTAEDYRHMPTKKPKRNAERVKPPADMQQQEQRAGKESTNGLSGRGADSVLAHLIEQEKTRGRKPERS